MDNINTNRIIGDCLEINGDIIASSYSSRIPKFICNFRERYYRKKLISTVEKLRKANTPLNKDNIFELVSYIYNNYQPNCEFGKIKKIIYFDKIDSFHMYVFEENIKATFKISQESKKFVLSIEIDKKRGNNLYNLNLETLESNNKDISKEISKLNSVLVETMTDYILSILYSYQKGVSNG